MKSRSEPLLEEGPGRFYVAPQVGVVQHLESTQRELNNPIQQYDVLPSISQKYDRLTRCHGIAFAARSLQSPPPRRSRYYTAELSRVRRSAGNSKREFDFGQR